MNDFAKLCIDAARGTSIQNYSSKDMSEAVRKEFISLMGTDKPDYRTFREHAPKVFAIIEVVLDQVITSGIMESPFFQQFVEYRDLNLGDTAEFYVEDRTMLTVSKVADGHVNLRRQKLNIGNSFTVSTQTYGVKIYGDFLRFISGRLDWTGLLEKIDQALRYKLATDIYTNFMGSAQYLPAQFVASGTFSRDTLNGLVQYVKTATQGAPLVIAGTHNALRKISASFSSSNSFLMSWKMADTINDAGILNQFEGIPLLEIPQIFVPNTFNFQIDDSKLMILPANNKPIKVVREGQTIIRETNEGNADMSIEHTVLTKYGIATIFNVAYGMYTLS